MVTVERYTERQGMTVIRHKQESLHVLVVDDEAPIVELLCMVLEEEGFEATGVTSGQRAAEVVRTRTPDLVLTDVMMPGVSGYDLAELITGMHPDTRVVLMSAAVQPAAESSYRFIAKPFDLGAMLDVIDQELRAS